MIVDDFNFTSSKPLEFLETIERIKSFTTLHRNSIISFDTLIPQESVVMSIRSGEQACLMYASAESRQCKDGGVTI